MLFVSSENRTFPTILGQKTLQKYKYISVALQREALWGKVCPLARWQQEEKERFPRMTGRASPGAPAAPSWGTSANAQICEFLRIITTMRENKQTNKQWIKVQSTLLFFFFSSLNRSACVQGVPCERPWGVLSRRAAGGGSFPLALGPRGRPAARGWVLSCSTDAALCLCMGRTTFWSGEEAVLALTNVSCPRTSLHTPRPDYIHSIYTHTLARGDKERATVPLRIARQCHGNKKKKPKPQPLQKD